MKFNALYKHFKYSNPKNGKNEIEQKQKKRTTFLLLRIFLAFFFVILGTEGEKCHAAL